MNKITARRTMAVLCAASLGGVAAFAQKVDSQGQYGAQGTRDYNYGTTGQSWPNQSYQNGTRRSQPSSNYGNNGQSWQGQSTWNQNPEWNSGATGSGEEGQNYGTTGGSYGNQNGNNHGWGWNQYDRTYGSSGWQSYWASQAGRTFHGKVQDIDTDNNTITVQGPQGTRTFKIDLNKGDEVTVRYRSENGQPEVVALSKSNSSMGSSGSFASSESGSSESSFGTHTFQGKIKKIDQNGETVRVKSNHGTRTFHLSSSSQIQKDGSQVSLSDLQQGDKVTIQFQNQDGNREVTSLSDYSQKQE